jgi:DNA primase
LQATVNPKNNLAYCFCCGENTNNIDLMMLQGHDFLGAVRLLKNWLDQYRHDLGLPQCSETRRLTHDEPTA